MDGFTISADATELLALLDKVGDAVDDVCRDVSRETAKRLVFGAMSRVQRATGQTAKGIHFEESRDRKGFVVLAYPSEGDPRGPVDYWLQYGSKFMHAKPFFFAEAALEESGHLRRMTEAVSAKLEEMGF
jgi:hypothetical protein